MVDVNKRKLRWLENREQKRFPPVEVTTLPRHYEITAELAGRLNAELAHYNRDRNALSLWSVLAICLESKIPVPDQVSEFFLNISQKLIGNAHNGEKQARQSISDLVLDTINEDGGQGVFRSFLSAEKERDIVRHVRNIVLQQIAGKLPAHESLEAVYETVAMEFDVQPEHVKKLVRLHEADAGSFGFRELLEAVTRSPQVFVSGLDTTAMNPNDGIHSEEPSN